MSHLKRPAVGAFAVPNVTETDLSSFYDAHFGEAALAMFTKDFLEPNKAPYNDDAEHEDHCEGEYYDEEYFDEDEEDDGLGYYPDGVKRTLTDEQIAIFRHSELQTLQRVHEKTLDRGGLRRNSSSPVPMDLEDGEAEEGEVPIEEAQLAPLVKSTKKTKKKKKRGSGNGNKRWEPDPDRRKRTWDVVETGLNGLDYGETEQSASPAEHVAQRRRITYDDG